MSYILEALKRSQQERELGQVPTLASAPFVDAGRPASSRPWLIAALALALLAMVLALYAAFVTHHSRSTAPAPEPTLPASPASATAPPAPEAAPRQDLAADATGDAMDPAQSADDSYEQEEIVIDLSPVEVADTVVDQPAVPDGTIPSDLLGKVEAFKRHLEQEPGGPARFPGAVVEANRPRPAAPSQPPPEPEEPVAEPAPDGARRPPERVELPPAVQARIPAQRLTVHVYAREPAARFAIINAQKLRQGEHAGDGVILEEIRQDGVILSFEGHRFFEGR